MSYAMTPFCPGATTATLSGATTTSSVNTGATGRVQVSLYNAGSVVVFIKAGSSSVTAATSDYPLVPGAREVLTFRGNTDGSPLYIAGITASSTATVYVTAGEGV